MKFRLNKQKGSYLICFMWEGKQKRLFIGTSDEVQAIRMLRKIEYEYLQGEFDETFQSYRLAAIGKALEDIGKPKPLLEIYDQWVNQLEVPEETKRNHYQNLRQAIEKHNPFWNDTQWILGLKVLWSSYTFNSRKGFLKACINWAINEGLVKGINPYEFLKAKKRNKEDHVKPFTRQEIEAIIGHIEEVDPFYLGYVKFQLLTGCRPGEAIALEWKHIDWQKGKVLVTQALARDTSDSKWASKKAVKGTKNGVVGYLPMSTNLRGLLTQQQALDSISPSRWVFPGKTGNYLDIRNFRKLWKKWLVELQIEYRYPYQMRHTVLSEVASNQGLLAASKLGRHKNSRMVSENYARFVDQVELPELFE